MQVLGEVKNIPLLPMFQDPLWPGVIATERVLSMGEIELFDYKLSHNNWLMQN